jgi:3'-5' exoribonuclease
MACIKTYDSKKFLDCPAASQIHHAYPSGLLIHTAEVLALCQGIYEASKEHYGFVDKDVLYSGAILHDIGKIETYRINEIGIAEKLPEERSTGHIYLGMRLVERVAKEMGMAEDFTREVIHCIAAHHGKTEYGSVKPVQSQEALIISCADLISSRNGKLQGKLQENVKSGLPLPPDFDIYRDHYFASIGMKNYIAKNQ